MNLRHLFWTLIFIFATPVFGATVLLEDGTVLKGEVVSETETEIVIRTSLMGELKVSRSSVKMLEREEKTGEETSTGGEAVLQDRFGEFEDQVAGLILGEVAGADTAAFYKALDRKVKGPFLQRFWRGTNSMVLKYYYNHHFGDRYYTVSDAYFERGNLIPRKYEVGAPIPHRGRVEEAEKILDRMLILHPDDPVAMSALGYVKLELDEVKEAEKLFLKAIKKERRFVEARNGRALAVLKKPGEKSRALKLFRETCAMNDNYAAAHYNLAMCHLSMVGLDRVDLDHYFGRVVERFPDHYDAYFKLGMFYESLRYYDKAMAAYSSQAAVNPGHPVTPSRLAHVAMMLKDRGKETYSLVDLEEMALKSPKDYLPLLAEALIDREDFVRAQDAYASYLAVLDPTEREFYEDLSLLATPEEGTRMRGAYGRGLTRLREQFWLLSDPTPTTKVNERRVEHYRRVHHALANYAEGIEEHHGRGWDRRGDVYIRFGQPDHQSWSDYLVFETDEKVARVKNRLNTIAGEALEEVYRSKHIHGQSQSSYGYGVQSATTEIKGMPTFPIPSRRSVMADGSELGFKWEVWIYAEVAGGIEITFLDPTGKRLYDYAPVPPNSVNYALWVSLAPENVVARVTNRTPSIYDYDYGGDPLDFYLYTADFRDEKGTGLEVYMGVPVDQLGRKERDGVVYASLDREVAIYNSLLQAVFQDSVQAQEVVQGDVSAGTMMVDQVRADLRPGKYLMAIQVRDPVSERIQVHKGYVELEAYGDLDLRLSDLEVAGLVAEREDLEVGKFRKGVLEVIPMPSKTFVKGQTVYLYYELYNLVRDSFGQTKYRVDYTLKGSDPSSIARVLGGVGRLLGRSTQKDGVRVSYEHSGQSDWESIYISLDVSPVEGDELEVEVQVTDLNARGKPSDAKMVRFVLGD